EELDEELVDRVVAAARSGTGAVDQLRRASRAYIDACAEPAIARLLVDAPAMLGPDDYRAISTGSCFQLLDAALANAEAEGIDVPGDRRTAAGLLVGVLNEAAALVSSSP